MFEYHDPEKEEKYFLDKSPQFWDRFVKALFASGIIIAITAIVFNWLGYFG